MYISVLPLRKVVMVMMDMVKYCHICCRWDKCIYFVRKNKIPSKNPAAAGINAYFPISSDISIAGIRSDHTDAATITPDANPRSIF